MGPIILFDGVCNFCNGSVNFIIRRDRDRRFKFAALQSEAGARVLAQCGITEGEVDSVILFEDGRAFTHSEGALRIAKRLGAPWSWFAVSLIVPSFIRDGVYKLVARNRYRLFGKRDECMLPTPDIRERFLD